MVLSSRRKRSAENDEEEEQGPACKEHSNRHRKCPEDCTNRRENKRARVEELRKKGLCLQCKKAEPRTPNSKYCAACKKKRDTKNMLKYWARVKGKAARPRRMVVSGDSVTEIVPTEPDLTESVPTAEPTVSPITEPSVQTSEGEDVTDDEEEETPETVELPMVQDDPFLKEYLKAKELSQKKEKDLVDREKRIFEREEILAKREESLAKRESELKVREEKVSLSEKTNIDRACALHIKSEELDKKAKKMDSLVELKSVEAKKSEARCTQMTETLKSTRKTLGQQCLILSLILGDTTSFKMPE